MIGVSWYMYRRVKRLLEEANETGWGAVGVKFVELQQILKLK